MIKRFLLLITILAICFDASAQKRIDYSGGALLKGSVKIPIWGSVPAPTPFFGYGAGGYLYIGGNNSNQFSCWGASPKALSYLIKGGITLDKITYMLKEGSSITLEVLSLDINPEIVFPAPLQKVQFTLGAGLHVNFPGATGTVTTIRNSIHSHRMDLKATADQAIRAMRRWVPYISGGLYLSRFPGQRGRKINLQLSLQQPLLSLFRQPVSIVDPSATSGQATEVRAYFPLLAQLSVGYQLM